MVELDWLMVGLMTLNDWIVGDPLQAAGAGVADGAADDEEDDTGVAERDAAGEGDAGGAGTLIFTDTLSPNREPLDARNLHCPVWLPGGAGALIGTVKFTVAPGAVTGTGMTVDVVMSSPATRTSRYPAPHVQVPLLAMRQVLLNTSPAFTLVPSGIVTSATNAALFVHSGAEATRDALADEDGGADDATLDALEEDSLDALERAALEALEEDTAAADDADGVAAPAAWTRTVTAAESLIAPVTLCARTTMVCVPGVAFHV